MPVSDANAINLLRAFGMVEFTLKRIPGFTRSGRHQRAEANWRALDEAIERLSAQDFFDLVTAPTRDKLLGGGRNRPKIQMVTVAHGRNTTHFKELDLHVSDARALVEAMRRVRNNLFHGGKEDPLEEPYHGDDDEWAVAAAEIAHLLLRLLDDNTIRP
ncbi:hypothetical protein [Lysobacter capsici]|uniref:hypothetical protein n=1 Tax=Lysobacter capsici TaxID=435897 RepID=UPI001E2BD821|nr:hypothetical protein [Lysobacter capsici]